MLRNCVCLELARGVGWGGVGMMTFFELEHMVDATQLCLSCHCTHGGCYATVFVLSLHTRWTPRNCVCLVIAHMVDANCVCLVIAHMVDARIVEIHSTLHQESWKQCAQPQALGLCLSVCV